MTEGVRQTSSPISASRPSASNTRVSRWVTGLPIHVGSPPGMSAKVRKNPTVPSWDSSDCPQYVPHSMSGFARAQASMTRAVI